MPAHRPHASSPLSQPIRQVLGVDHAGPSPSQTCLALARTAGQIQVLHATHALSAASIQSQAQAALMKAAAFSQTVSKPVQESINVSIEKALNHARAVRDHKDLEAETVLVATKTPARRI